MSPVNIPPIDADSNVETSDSCNCQCPSNCCINVSRRQSKERDVTANRVAKSSQGCFAKAKRK